MKSLDPRFYLSLAIALFSLGTAQGVLVQVDSQFVAFNAELGTIDDAPANASKFDVMGPDGGSFGNYLNALTPGGNVSFDVEFSENTIYTVFVRYREPQNVTPNFELDFDGGTASGIAWASSSMTFDWVHVSGMDFTASATPGGETVTLRVDSFGSGPADPTLEIDAVALVERSAITSGGFTVSDVTVPESSFSTTIPEPSSALLLLMGNCLLLLRRRRA